MGKTELRAEDVERCLKAFSGEDCRGCPYDSVSDLLVCSDVLLSDALAAVEERDDLRAEVCELTGKLGEKEARGNPQPLTLDELLEMDGEPVFAIDLESSGIADDGEWLIISDGYLYGVDVMDDLFDYGETWLAYRQKPKEAEA